MLAVGRRDPTTRTRDVWLMDLVRGTQSRFTFDPAADLNPVWSPDGKRIAFTSNRRSQRDIYEKAASGASPERLLLSSDLEKNVEDWSPDGKMILFNQTKPRSAGRAIREVWAVPVEGEPQATLVLTGPARLDQAQISPDGKFIAYTSSESGHREVYVQNYSPSGGRWQISNAGDTTPQWRGDSREIYYIEGLKLMAVDINSAGPSLEAGIPHALFETRFGPLMRNMYLPSRDGRKFLINMLPQEAANSPLTVVVALGGSA